MNNVDIQDAIEKSIAENMEKRDRRDISEERNRHKKEVMSKLEKELGVMYVGSLDIDNELKVKANVFADPEAWKYKVNITYKLNGRKHFLKAEEDMSTLSSPTELNRFIRSYVLDSLSRVITNEVFNQNQRTYKSISKEYAG